MLLADKVCVITGAASGIGAATAVTVAREGARVVGLDVTAAPDVRRCDVSDEESVASALDEAAGEHGRLDALVACAGVEHQAVATETDLTDWQRVIDVNLTGVFLCAKHAIPRMPRGGSFVAIASVSGLVATDGEAAYCASKAGVIGLARALAVDHAGAGIRVNAICPGVIDTPMNDELWRERGEAFKSEVAALHALGRLGRADAVAAAAAFLASDKSSFVTGTAWPIDGGFTAL
jgi:NAD(P)-dependent dehydrogenase (short-subunit alcohol dehydrogenase family)